MSSTVSVEERGMAVVIKIVEQTILYAEQKRDPGSISGSVWYPVTRDEMKAWVTLYLNMGLVTR